MLSSVTRGLLGRADNTLVLESNLGIETDTLLSFSFHGSSGSGEQDGEWEWLGEWFCKCARRMGALSKTSVEEGRDLSDVEELVSLLLGGAWEQRNDVIMM